MPVVFAIKLQLSKISVVYSTKYKVSNNMDFFHTYGHFLIQYILYGHFISYGHFPLWTLFHMDILLYGQFADSPTGQHEQV